MKKWLTFFIVFILILSSGFGSYLGIKNIAADEGCSDCTLRLSYRIGSTKYWVDDVEKGPMESAPMIRHDRTFILVRYVVESLPGTEIGWDGAERKVTINTADGKKIDLWIDNHMAEVDGQPLQIDANNPDVKPFIDGGRTFLPFRFIGEQLGTCDIKWYGDTRTVELIFNIDGCCEWTEIGDIEKITDANGKLVIKFYEGCGKEFTELFPENPNLEAENSDATLVKYKGECARFCLDSDGNVVKWEAVSQDDCCPDIFGDCCDWVVEQDEAIFRICAGETKKFPIIIKNNCQDGLIKLKLVSLYPEDSSANQSIRLSAGETKTVLIPVAMPADCEPGKIINKGFKITSSCGDEEKFARINAECVDCSCCEFENSFLEIPETICPGDVFDVKLRTTNLCENNELKFKVEKSSQSVGEISPKYEDSDAEFTVLAGENHDVYFKCVMPADCKEGEKIKFALETTAYDKNGKACGKKLHELEVDCVNCEVCCDFSVTYGRIPPPVYPGESFQLGLYLKNLCEEDDLKFVMTDVSAVDAEGCFGKIYDIDPNDVTVTPGRTEMIKTQNTMPEDCEDGGKCSFKVKIEAYTEDGQLCGSKILEYKVECKSCCEFEYELNPMIETYCAGDEFTRTLKVKNTCEDSNLSFKFDEADGDWSNITKILPATLELEPGAEKEVSIDCKVPADSEDGEQVTFGFKLMAATESGSLCGEMVTFGAVSNICEDPQPDPDPTPEACCDVAFAPKLKMIPTACAGESGSYQMIVKNNCTDEIKTVSFFWADDSGITTMSHKMLTLEPDEMETVVVNFRMPDDCVIGEGADFHFMAYVSDCPNLAGKFTVICQECEDEKCCQVSIYPKFRLAISACPGEEGSYQMVVKNNCEDEIRELELDLDSLSSEVLTVEPSKLTLKPGEAKDIIVSLKMPECTPDKNVLIGFGYKVADCWTVKGFFNVACIECGGCCDVSIYSKIKMIPSACAGEENTYQMVVKNNCEDEVKNIEMVWSRGSGITAIAPPKFTLKPGELKDITCRYIMPDCVVGKSVKMEFEAIVNDCMNVKDSFNVTCKDCTCCDVGIAAKMRSIPVKCSGESGKYSMIVENKCEEDTKEISFMWDRSSGISNISPAKLFLEPGEMKTIEIDYTMPDCKPGGVQPFKFTTYINGCDSLGVKFDVVCRECACCDLTVIPHITPLRVPAGETDYAEFLIRNNCDEEITVTLENVQGMMTIKPNKLTIPSGKSETAKISFKMPPNNGIVRQKVATFKFKIQAPDCDDKEVMFMVDFK